MISSIYVFYLVTSLFILFLWSKLPPALRVAGLVGATTLVSNLDPEVYSIFDAIRDYQAGKIDFLQLLWTFVSSFFVSLDKIDSNLEKAVLMLNTNRVQAVSGVLLFASLDILYLFTLSMVIFWIFALIRNTIKQLIGTPIKYDSEELTLLLVSLIIAVFIAYAITGLEGLISLVNFGIKKIISLG